MPPTVDFDNNRVLWVSLGRKSTTGHGLDLHRDTASIVDDTAVIVLDRQMPPPDAIAAQLVTNPCLLLELPITGISRVRMVDINGKVLGETGY